MYVYVCVYIYTYKHLYIYECETLNSATVPGLNRGLHKAPFGLSIGFRVGLDA